MGPDLSKETDARIVIDELLRQALWDPSDKSQVLTEFVVRDHVEEPEEPYMVRGASSGRADYVLLKADGRPLAVIEAKKKAIHPYTAKQQTLPYAKQIGAPFIFLTNGELIYFWDYTNDDARLVNSFFSRRDLERMLHQRQEQVPLATIEIPQFYLRNGESREVRPYQREAMKALDQAVELGKRRFLIELPTGTGKTDLTCLYLERLIKSGRAERILFLVDRDQLARQALEATQDILGRYGSYWLKSGRTREEKQITICLLQTMISRYTEFTSGYFDVVVADESHRSIYGSWQTALTHFDAFHLGLTATPAAYIERNTFQFYQCETGKPDFTFPIQQAFKDQFLIPYKFATGITNLIAQGADVDDEHYDPFEFERKWTNEDTNRKMMAEFDKLASGNYKEIASSQKTSPGKTIVFAITKHHASRLAQYLNELHPDLKGKYAEVITSDVSNADELIRKFKREEYPQIAVSVGMLDTGFDCREVLHLVMCRRIRSPILYQQIRGRGTRTAPHIGKEKFIIYDFFRNHEYFNDSDTDVFTGTGTGRAPGGRDTQNKPSGTLFELGLEDEWFEAVTYIEVGTGGERVDKKDYVSRWERFVVDSSKVDSAIQKVRAGQLLNEEEENALEQKLNKPELYFNEENLKRAYRQPEGTLVDFIRFALGASKVKSKEERLSENFHAWLVSKNLNVEQAQYLTLLKNRGIVKGKVDMEDLFRPPLSILNSASLGVELFGEKQLTQIIQELDESIFVPERKRA